MSRKPLVLVLVLVLVSALAYGQWKSEPVQSVKRLERGKTVKTYTAPNKSAKLLLRDHNEQGDFVWLRLYLVSGKKIVLIDAFNEVSNVAWSKDSKSVQFRAVKATDYNEFTHMTVRYTVGARSSQYKVMKVEKIDMIFR